MICVYTYIYIIPVGIPLLTWVVPFFSGNSKGNYIYIYVQCRGFVQGCFFGRICRGFSTEVVPQGDPVRTWWLHRGQYTKMSIPMENQHIGLKGYDFGGALFSGVSSHDFNLVSVFMILPLGEKTTVQVFGKKYWRCNDNRVDAKHKNHHAVCDSISPDSILKPPNQNFIMQVFQ